VLLSALAIFIVGWDLWAVLADLRPSGGDTFTNTTLHLYDHLTKENPWGFFSTDGPKGPFAPLLSLPFLVLLGQVPLATRLVCVAAHGALVWQTYDLGRRLYGGPWTGLLASVMLSTSPMVFGWARLDFHECLLASVVTATLQLMVRARLDGPILSLLLGLVLGVGILTKLGYVVFMVAPGIWFVLRRLRGVRSGLYLLLTLGFMSLVAYKWVRNNMDTIMGNYHMTTSFREAWWLKAAAYVADPPTYLLFAAGLAAVAVLWWKRLADRWVLALYVPFIGLSLVQFSMLFDYWTRYTVPLYPAASVLAAAGLVLVLGRLPRLPARLLAAAFAGYLLVSFVQLNLAPVVGPNAREFTFGMFVPDTRPYDGLSRAMGVLRPLGGKVLLLVEPGPAHTRWAGMEQIWNFRGVPLNKMDPGEFFRHQPEGQGVSVLFIRPEGSHSFPAPGRYAGRCPTFSPPDSSDSNQPVPDDLQWLAGQRDLRCLYTAVDPDGLAYTAYHVPSSRKVKLGDEHPPAAEE